MKYICLNFKVHQPLRLRIFPFFDIGASHYNDDATNESFIKRIADNCYLPANNIILDLINKYNGQFKVSYSISGTAIDQFKIYSPEVIESFRILAQTGCVEFTAQTYSNSLAVLKDNMEFSRQVMAQSELIKTLFGKRPTTFSNSEFVYSNEIATLVANLGYTTILTEPTNQIRNSENLKSTYRNTTNPSLIILLNNTCLSDDIALRFLDADRYGLFLTAQKYVSRLINTSQHDRIVNLSINYETFGERLSYSTGIFEFLASLPTLILRNTDFEFINPCEGAKHCNSISELIIPYTETRTDPDYSVWLGNELQQQAFEKLYRLSAIVSKSDDPFILKDWQYLQTRDHFYYMNSKYFSRDFSQSSYNPYNNPYQAFMNYMKILSDFSIRVTKTKVKGPY